MKRMRNTIAGGLMIAILAAGAALSEDTALKQFAEAFGALEGISLYNGQLLVGMTADAYIHDVYTDEEGLHLVGLQISALDIQKEYLEKIIALPETAGETQLFEDMIDSINKLKATAVSLETFIKNPSQANADDFELKRQASFDTISRLMGLEE